VFRQPGDIPRVSVHGEARDAEGVALKEVGAGQIQEGPTVLERFELGFHPVVMRAGEARFCVSTFQTSGANAIDNTKRSLPGTPLGAHSAL